jgi:hypothetical protein
LGIVIETLYRPIRGFAILGRETGTDASWEHVYNLNQLGPFIVKYLFHFYYDGKRLLGLPILPPEWIYSWGSKTRADAYGIHNLSFERNSLYAIRALFPSITLPEAKARSASWINARASTFRGSAILGNKVFNLDLRTLKDFSQLMGPRSSNFWSGGNFSGATPTR